MDWGVIIILFFSNLELISLNSLIEINFESIKKGMICGTITASFCIESFGVEGLKKLDKKKLDKRVEIFKSYLMKVS